jgi:hypothetical protein
MTMRAGVRAFDPITAVAADDLGSAIVGPTLQLFVAGVYICTTTRAGVTCAPSGS